MKTLVILPLAIMFVVTMLSQLGLGASTTYGSSDVTIGTPLNQEGWYDTTVHLVAYGNGTPVDSTEAGYLVYNSLATLRPLFTPAFTPHFTPIPSSIQAFYINSTDTYPVNQGSTITTINQGHTVQFNIGTGLGLIALISALMIFISVIGIKALGIGLSDVSLQAVLVGTALIFVWGMFSVLSLSLITAIPIFGALLYFGLTIMYTLGIISSWSGGGDGL